MNRQILAIALLFASTAVAQTQHPASKTPATTRAAARPAADEAGKEADIRKLLQLTGNLQMVNQMKSQMIEQMRQASPDLPAEMLTELSNEMRAEDLENAMVPIYAKHFTNEEIKQLIAFYDSPFGKKLIREMPQIIAEANVVGADWGQGVVKRVARKWRQSGKITESEYEKLVGEEAQ